PRKKRRGSRPSKWVGKADGTRNRRATTGPCPSTGVMATACPHTEEPRNTGDPKRGVRDPTGHPRGIGRAAWGVGEVHSTCEAANPGGGKGPHFQVNARRGKSPGDWR